MDESVQNSLTHAMVVSCITNITNVFRPNHTLQLLTEMHACYSLFFSLTWCRGSHWQATYQLLRYKHACCMLEQWQRMTVICSYWTPSMSTLAGKTPHRITKSLWCGIYVTRLLTPTEDPVASCRCEIAISFLWKYTRTLHILIAEIDKNGHCIWDM